LDEEAKVAEEPGTAAAQSVNHQYIGGNDANGRR
jgi:hypothetical protein